MVESSNLITFNGLTNSSGYDTFLLDEERGRLLVGAEDHVFSFDLVNLNREHKQVRVLLFDRTQGQRYEDNTMTTQTTQNQHLLYGSCINTDIQWTAYYQSFQ